MTSINKLIQQYCPDGVEHIRLNTICKIYDGTHSTPNYTDSGIKFVSVENIFNLYTTKKYISKKDFEKYKIKPQIGDVFMTRIGSIGICTVVDSNEPLAYYVSLALLRPDKQIINSKFLKYAIESVHGQKELRKRTLINAVPIKINKDDIGKIIIPIPPLEVQEKIVRILDNFTELTKEMTTKLTTELESRKKQYEYYRDSLLMFDDTPYKTLREIFDTKNGYTPSKSNSDYWNGDTCIPWFRMEDIREHGNILTNSIEHVTLEAVKGKLFPENSIIVATSATIGEHALIKVKSLANQRFTYLMLKEEYQPFYDIKFLYYYCYKLDLWCLSHLKQGNFASVDMTKFYEFTFPVPPLEVQKRIVRILDNFTALTTEVTEELTTELNARKKQYEYYRDKLLTFKERERNEKFI